METELTEAKLRLDELADARASLQADLAAAVENADAENMIQLQEKIDRNSVYIYAERAKLLRLQKLQDANERSIAINEREALEAELVLATRVYEKQIEDADEARIKMQMIQVKLYGKDSLIESYRQDINEQTRQLRTHIAN